MNGSDFKDFYPGGGTGPAGVERTEAEDAVARAQIAAIKNAVAAIPESYENVAAVKTALAGVVGALKE